MKTPLILIILLLSSCIPTPEERTVNVTVTQELFGNSPIGLQVVTWEQLYEPEVVPDYFRNIPTTTERDRVLSVPARHGDPFVLLIENRQRYTRLRIHVNGGAHPSYSALSIPQVGDVLHILIFDNGDNEKTRTLESIIRQATGFSTAYEIRKVNY